MVSVPDQVSVDRRNEVTPLIDRWRFGSIFTNLRSVSAQSAAVLREGTWCAIRPLLSLVGIRLFMFVIKRPRQTGERHAKWEINQVSRVALKRIRA